MLNYNRGTGEYKNWIVEETSFDDRYQGKCESIMALGNGYLGLRSAFEEPYLGQTRNLFIAGTYNKFDRQEVTELPNAADITEMVISMNGEVFSLKDGRILEYSRQLNLKTGELIRLVLWQNKRGEEYKILFRRFVSLEDRHLIGMKVEITPISKDADISVRTGINGRQTNSGVQHFHDGDKRVYDNKYIQLLQKTTETKIDFVFNSTVNFYLNDKVLNCKLTYSLQRRSLYCSSMVTVAKGETLTVEKVNNIFTSLDNDLNIYNNLDIYKDIDIHKDLTADKDLEKLKKLSLDHLVKNSGLRYDDLFENSRNKWAEYWEKATVEIQTDNDFDVLALRFAQYHLLIMTPFHDERFSVGAKALTGEGYKGHVFWDTEIFILPYFQYTFPDIAKKLLKYRYITIEGARNKAKKFGYRGAMYPWETAFTGEEETPEWAAINIMTGKATKVWSGIKEHHITADIAYAVWNYYLSTKDEDFMDLYGCKIIFECAEFWYSRLWWNLEKNRYEIKDVIGPDEYTEHINNNAYTNYLAHFTIETSIDLYDMAVSKGWSHIGDLDEKLNLKERIDNYKAALDSIYLPKPNDDHIIPQDDTFLTKPCIDLTKYKNSDEKQTILKDYTRDAVVNMQILKQADVVMLLYLLRAYFDERVKRGNWQYYEERTIHDSSLSAAVHSIVASDFGDTESAYRFFKKAAEIDLGQNMISSNEGIHAASMGGIWLAVIMGFGGITNDDGVLSINPKLPKAWIKLSFALYWMGERINISIDGQEIRVAKESESIINITIKGNIYLLKREVRIDLNSCDL
ncbi:glycoside hydrolase family 65 protein [Clostridium thermarum]|uniref:glycoside hydrolase family 65 protein n=1 Tax=Clostridium thermarum TaxID=1716543 RepID=UPI0011243996|nr:glycosyl hydrolase family 65 protein [Clostridium thermarum]